MANFQGKFTSTKQDWTTPKPLFAALDAEFHFTCDLAASEGNTLCGQYFSQETDGLRQSWSGTCWLNPPYGDPKSKMIDLIKRADSETKRDTNLTVVIFIPTTGAFHTNTVFAEVFPTFNIRYTKCFQN